MPPRAYAQSLNIPAPGAMVSTSPSFMPVMMKGLKVHPENPHPFWILSWTHRQHEIRCHRPGNLRPITKAHQNYSGLAHY